MQYVETNPVRVRIVRKACRYPWSSAEQHYGRTTGDGLPDLAACREMLGNQDWIDVLTEAPGDTETRGLRLNTHTGRSLAFQVAHRGHRILIVHWTRVEPPLPQVPATPILSKGQTPRVIPAKGAFQKLVFP